MTDMSEKITIYKQKAIDALSDGTHYVVDAYAVESSSDGDVLFDIRFCSISIGLRLVSVVGMKVVSNQSPLYPYETRTDLHRFTKTVWEITLNAGGFGKHYCEGRKWNERQGSWNIVLPPSIDIVLSSMDGYNCLSGYSKLIWKPFEYKWHKVLVKSYFPLLFQKTEKPERNERTFVESYSKDFKLL